MRCEKWIFKSTNINLVGEQHVKLQESLFQSIFQQVSLVVKGETQEYIILFKIKCNTVIAIYLKQHALYYYFLEMLPKQFIYFISSSNKEKKSLQISTKNAALELYKSYIKCLMYCFNVGQIVSWHSSQNTWDAQHDIDSLHASSSLKSSGSTETTHSTVLMVIFHFNLLNMSANFSRKSGWQMFHRNLHSRTDSLSTTLTHRLRHNLHSSTTH